MSSRYQPVHDARYSQRPRSRSPPPYQDRRTSTSFGQPFTGHRDSRDPPAGPRSAVPGHFDDPPDYRGGPPMSAPRDRFSNRDREPFDRRTRPPSPGWADHRSGPQSPRAPDFGPPRPDRKEYGPLPFSGNTAPGYSARDSSFRGRYRGRGDFDGSRDYARRPPFDDGPPSRRSPPPRWASRDGPPESHSHDFRSDRLSTSDRLPERDFRDREAPWSRRDTDPKRYDGRLSNENSRPPTPHQTFSRGREDDFGARRTSTAIPYNTPKRDARLDPPSNNLDPPSSTRATNPSTRFARASSPPHAPSVPAFGSFTFVPPAKVTPPQSSTKPSQARETTNVPEQQEPDVNPETTPVTAAVVSTAPVAPPTNVVPAQQSGPPPEAPKAPRSRDGREPSRDREGTSAQKPFPPSDLQPPRAPAALRANSAFQPPPFRRPRSSSFREGPSSEFPARPSAPNSDRGVSSEHGHESPALHSRMARHRTSTPPTSAPTGPRAHAMSTSPRPQPPTAPKADRIPSGPRASGPIRVDMAPPTFNRPPPQAPKPHGWNQWIAPGRESLVPMKRSLSGDAKTVRAPAATLEESDRPLQITSDAEAVVNKRRSVDNEYVATSNLELVASPAKSPQPTEQMISEPPPADKMELDEIGGPVEPALSESSSDEDLMDLDEDDVELTKAKFEKQRARLQAQLIDLSDRKYRAASPFQYLALLATIKASHLPPDRPQTPQHSVSGRQPASPPAVPPREAIERNFLTPKEDDEMVGLEESATAADKHRLSKILPPSRRRRNGSDVINLPYLARSPLSPRESLKDHAMLQSDVEEAILAKMQSAYDDDAEASHRLILEYSAAYRRFAHLSRQQDDIRASKEQSMLAHSADIGSDNPDLQPLSAETPTTESSRRLHKFSSEYDIQKVLKESEETARLEQEKQNKASKKAKDDQEKEALVPDLYTKEMAIRRRYVNRNTLRNPWYLTDVYGFQPPADDFSIDEHRIFLLAFKERPKKWGEIASLLPDRTYQDCIHHYYAHKWDGRFRENKGKRKSRMGRGRGGKVATRVRGAALMADLGRIEDDGPSTLDTLATATGRPKRAASSRAATLDKEKEKEKDRDKDSDSTKNTSTATPSKKTAAKTDSVETGPEKDKNGKQRRKKDLGDKVSRKSKAQTTSAVSTSNESPQKLENMANDTQRDGWSRLEFDRNDNQSLPPPTQPVVGLHPLDTVPSFSSKTLQQPALLHEHSFERARNAQASQQRPAASSYWSVPEQQDFMRFIAYFGSDFAAIAAHMGTKTQTMVKNYYQRSIDGGNRPDVEALIKSGNERSQRGEDRGPPPTPTQTIKRRYDNPQSAIPMAVVPHRSSSEVDAVPGKAPGVSTNTAMATSHPPHRNVNAAAAMQSSFDVSEYSHAASRPKQATGPKTGRFADKTLDDRKPENAQVSRIIDPGRQARLLLSDQQPQTQRGPMSRLPTEVRDSKSPWYQELLREQEHTIGRQRDHDHFQHGQRRLSQERNMPPVANAMQSSLSSLSNDRPMSAHASNLHRNPIKDERLTTPAFLATARPGKGVQRNMFGSSEPNAGPERPPQLPGTAYRSQDLSPPKYASFRPSSVPATSLSAPPLPPVSKLPDAPPREPARRSNLASLLNEEPEEPKSRKRLSDQKSSSANRPQSPAQMPERKPTPTVRSYLSHQVGQDSYGPMPVTRPMFDRPGVPAPSPGPQTYDGGHWSNASSARPREDWTQRDSVAQQLPPDSHSTLQYERERMTYYAQRPSLGSVNPLPSSRGRQSPPPTHGLSTIGRSRTSSYSQSTPIDQTAPFNSRPQSHSYTQGHEPRESMQRQPAASHPMSYNFSGGLSPQVQQLHTPQQYRQYDTESRRGSRDEVNIQRDRERALRAAYDMYPEQATGSTAGPSQSLHGRSGPPPSQYGGPPTPQQGPGPIGERPSLRQLAEREGLETFRNAQQLYAQQQQMQTLMQQQQQRPYRDSAGPPTAIKDRPDLGERQYMEREYGNPRPRAGTASTEFEEYVPAHAAWRREGNLDDDDRRRRLEADMRAQGAFVPRTTSVSHHQPPPVSGLPQGASTYHASGGRDEYTGSSSTAQSRRR